MIIKNNTETIINMVVISDYKYIIIITTLTKDTSSPRQSVLDGSNIENETNKYNNNY